MIVLKTMSKSLYDLLFLYLQWVGLFLHILRQYIFSFCLFYILIFRGFSNFNVVSFSVVSDWIYSHIFRFLDTLLGWQFSYLKYTIDMNTSHDQITKTFDIFPCGSFVKYSAIIRWVGQCLISMSTLLALYITKKWRKLICQVFTVQ